MRKPIARVVLVVLFAAAPMFGVSATAQAGRRGPPLLDPPNGEVVGIAQPVTVRFPTEISDRTAAERSITITTSTPVAGQFRWLDDSVVQWSPAEFWPAYTDVTVDAVGFRTQFQVGSALVAVANRSTHEFTVSIDGEVVQWMPASLGKPGYETPAGTFPVIEKFRDIVMDSSTYGVPITSKEGYKLDVEYAVRITWGGIFVHAAPWSADSQGYANVSHGCINLSTGNAAWFYNNAKRGDPVIVR